MVEAAISIAMMATAMVALTRLASSSAELNHIADRQLSATLAAENTLERLQSLPLDELSDQAAAVADEVASECGCQIKAAVEAIESPPGYHVTVTVAIGDQIELSLHDWRLEVPSEEMSDADPEPTDPDGDSASDTEVNP